MADLEKHLACLQVNSSSEQSMVVYTPCILDPVGGIATFNITLPNGFFCSDTMVDPSETLPCPATAGPALRCRPRPFMPCPAVYNYIKNMQQCSLTSVCQHFSLMNSSVTQSMPAYAVLHQSHFAHLIL